MCLAGVGAAGVARYSRHQRATPGGRYYNIVVPVYSSIWVEIILIF
jgi:hypothetical protein